MVMFFDPFAPITTERKKFNFNEEVKKELHTKQGGKCMYCGRKPAKDLMDIDHKNPIKPRSPNVKSGSNNMQNLQLLCRTCNTRKGNKTDREFRRMYKDAGVPQTQILPSKVIPEKTFVEVGKAVAAERKKRQTKAKKNDPFGFF